MENLVGWWFWEAVARFQHLRVAVAGLDGPTAFLAGGAAAVLVTFPYGRAVRLALGIGLLCLLVGYEAGVRHERAPARSTIAEAPAPPRTGAGPIVVRANPFR